MRDVQASLEILFFVTFLKHPYSCRSCVVWSARYFGEGYISFENKSMNCLWIQFLYFFWNNFALNMFYSLKKRTGRGVRTGPGSSKGRTETAFCCRGYQNAWFGLHKFQTDTRWVGANGALNTSYTNWDANMANIDTQETVCFGLTLNTPIPLQQECTTNPQCGPLFPNRKGS